MVIELRIVLPRSSVVLVLRCMLVWGTLPFGVCGYYSVLVYMGNLKHRLPIRCGVYEVPPRMLFYRSLLLLTGFPLRADGVGKSAQLTAVYYY